MQITFRGVVKMVCITIPYNKNIINTIKNIVTVKETNNCTTSRIWDYKVKKLYTIYITTKSDME